MPSFSCVIFITSIKIQITGGVLAQLFWRNLWCSHALVIFFSTLKHQNINDVHHQPISVSNLKVLRNYRQRHDPTTLKFKFLDTKVHGSVCVQYFL